MVRMKAAALILALSLGGCARTSERSDYFADPPSPEEQAKQTLAASEKGPSTWSAAVTVPLYPVLLAADTTIKFVEATYRWVSALFGGGADEGPALPERLERQAEKIPKN